MTRKPLAIGLSSVMLLMAGSLANAPASAEEYGGTAQLKSVTVVAPRVVRRQMNGRIQVEVTQKSAAVYHGDLDLSRTADVARLEMRISDAANQVCKELTEQIPSGQPDREVCASRAKEDAMSVANRVVRTAASVASR